MVLCGIYGEKEMLRNAIEKVCLEVSCEYE